MPPPPSPRGEEIALADVAGDPREVLGCSRHRRAVVESAPDAGVLDVLDELVQVLVRPCRACSRSEARDHELDVLRPEVLMQRLGHRAGEAGVAGRPLRVVADDQRQPGGVLRGGRVPVRVCPLDRVVGTPEVVVVLGFPAGDHRVRRCDVDVPEHSCRLAQVEAAGNRQFTERAVELLVGLLGVEENGLGLQRTPEGAVDPAVLLELRHVLRVALARQRDRRSRPVVRRRLEGERPHELELRVDRRRRCDRLEHARPRRLLHVGDDVVEVIAVRIASIPAAAAVPTALPPSFAGPFGIPAMYAS